jgi:hypothetical protein
MSVLKTRTYVNPLYRYTVNVLYHFITYFITSQADMFFKTLPIDYALYYCVTIVHYKQ